MNQLATPLSNGNETIHQYTNRDNLTIMQHIENGIVQHEWLADDEEHTEWYMNRFAPHLQ
jgi:hypothetical protein